MDNNNTLKTENNDNKPVALILHIGQLYYLKNLKFSKFKNELKKKIYHKLYFNH